MPFSQLKIKRHYFYKIMIMNTDGSLVFMTLESDIVLQGHLFNDNQDISPEVEIFSGCDKDMTPLEKKKRIRKTDPQKNPKSKKEQKKQPPLTKPEYKKNICGYIVKKIIKEFTTDKFSQQIDQLCEKYGCLKKDAQKYYRSKLEAITGPTHVRELLIWENEKEGPIKKVFKDFLLWFLDERYIRYLINWGKMQEKKEYIRYKNTKLREVINYALRQNEGMELISS